MKQWLVSTSCEAEFSSSTLVARPSERSLVTSDPDATGKFSGIPLGIHWNSTGNQWKVTGNQLNFSEWPVPRHWNSQWHLGHWSLLRVYVLKARLAWDNVAFCRRTSSNFVGSVSGYDWKRFYGEKWHRRGGGGGPSANGFPRRASPHRNRLHFKHFWRVSPGVSPVASSPLRSQKKYDRYLMKFDQGNRATTRNGSRRFAATRGDATQVVQAARKSLTGVRPMPQVTHWEPFTLSLIILNLRVRVEVLEYPQILASSLQILLDWQSLQRYQKTKMKFYRKTCEILLEKPVKLLHFTDLSCKVFSCFPINFLLIFQ